MIEVMVVLAAMVVLPLSSGQHIPVEVASIMMFTVKFSTHFFEIYKNSQRRNRRSGSTTVETSPSI